jgi:hypothetical protein
MRFEGSPTKKKFTRPYLQKPFTKIGLVEWLKVKALSSSPSTTKKKPKTKPIKKRTNPCATTSNNNKNCS